MIEHNFYAPTNHFAQELLAGTQFRVRQIHEMAELFGKDGGKKWEVGMKFDVKTIMDLIDSMPMRQQEKAR